MRCVFRPCCLLKVTEEDPSETLIPGITKALVLAQNYPPLGICHCAINLMSEIWLPLDEHYLRATGSCLSVSSWTGD